jgi:hypothetical protein
MVTLIETGDKIMMTLFRKKVEVSMRMMSLALALSFGLGSYALAQPVPNATGEEIGHPPPISGPPPVAEPSPAGKAQANTPSPNKGYTGAYAPPGTPPTPYSTGPLPESMGGPGLNTVAPDGVTTKAVKAVPCGAAARETDGFTTCVGISDESRRVKVRR